MRCANCILMCILFCIFPITVLAGNLEDPGPPSSADSAMYTLEDIYNRLDDGTAGAKRTGAFTEPAAGPAATGYTLDEVMGIAPELDDTDGAGVDDVVSGKKFWGLTSGAWGVQTGAGDPNLLPENIRSGVTIFGVTGTYTGP